jgi:hypothetical protein
MLMTTTQFRSSLDAILAQAGPLPATFAIDGEKLERSIFILRGLRTCIGHSHRFTIVDAMDLLLKEWFAGPSWDGWRATLKDSFCLPMIRWEREIRRKALVRRLLPVPIQYAQGHY